MKIIYIFSLISLISSYQLPNYFKINSINEFINYNHADSKNIENLEKLFYEKNRRYSPFKKNIYIKYQNNLYNNSSLKNNSIRNILNELNDQNINYTYDDGYKEDDDDVDDEKKLHNNKNGYLDPFGIFRYNIIAGQNQNHNHNQNSDSSDSHSFEIIKNPTHTFKDIGGYSKIKSELMQTADILTNFTKYQKYNVRTPKGIIFEGPPGNGKTLMAKGFSGEINASFIPVSGSEFSEKFVGVGASRVRELFKLASKNKPCIIFIDEIDAIARKRGNDAVSSNSEKDQTLNQLLINLDGYKNSDGIFIIGATNRIDLLDPALLRPGRIDKNIFIGNPDSETRAEIIKIHINKKPIDSSISNEYIVELSGGMSGAQIENLLNEAMLNALRENREIIIRDDLEYIANRIIAGWQATENKFSDNMIDRIVIHELGHALVGLFSNDHSKLIKVTLNLWSPKTPGYTLFENNDENANIYTKNGLLSHLMVLLGGRVAEEIFYGYSVTTGARKDLEQTYNLAKNMIIDYGMGEQSIYPDLSDQSKYLIDKEINKLLLIAHDRACLILNNSKELVIDCSKILKKKNILKPEDIINIINIKYPTLWELNDLNKE